MCGVAAFIVKKPKKKNVYIAQALILENEIRGRDSAGIWANDILLRDTKNATTFTKEQDLSFVKDATRCLIHTRAKTHGDIVPENAHPVPYEKTIGVHNGMISNYKDISPEFDLDSMAIWKAFNEADLDYETATKRIRGSLSCIWIERGGSADELKVLSHTNPLSMIKTPDGVYLSSLGGSLKRVFESHMDVKNIEIVDVPKDEVHTITVEGIIDSKPVTFKQWESTQKTGYTPSSKAFSSNDTSSYPIQKFKKPSTGFSVYTLMQAWGRSDSTKSMKKKRKKVFSRLFKDRSDVQIYEELMIGVGCSICKKHTFTGCINRDSYKVYCRECTKEMRRETGFSKNFQTVDLFQQNDGYLMDDRINELYEIFYHNNRNTELDIDDGWDRMF